MSWVTTDVIKKQIIKQIKSNEVINLSEFGLSKSTCKILPMLKGIEFDSNYPSIKKIEVIMDWVDNYKLKIYLKTHHTEDVFLFGGGGSVVNEGNNQIVNFDLTEATSVNSTNFVLNHINIGEISDTQYTYNTPNGLGSIQSNARLSVNGVEFANFGYHTVLQSGSQSKWIYKNGNNIYGFNRSVNNNINFTITYGRMKAYSGVSLYDYTLPWSNWRMQNVYLNISYENINTASLINVVIWEV